MAISLKNRGPGTKINQNPSLAAYVRGLSRVFAPWGLSFEAQDLSQIGIMMKSCAQSGQVAISLKMVALAPESTKSDPLVHIRTNLVYMHGS